MGYIETARVVLTELSSVDTPGTYDLSGYVEGGFSFAFSKTTGALRDRYNLISANPDQIMTRYTPAFSINALWDVAINFLRTHRIDMRAPWVIGMFGQWGFAGPVLGGAMPFTPGADGAPVTMNTTMQGGAGKWYSFNHGLARRYNTDGTVTALLPLPRNDVVTPNIALDPTLPVLIAMNKRGSDATGNNEIGLLTGAGAADADLEYPLFDGLRTINLAQGKTLNGDIAPKSDAPGIVAGTGALGDADYAPAGFTPSDGNVDVFVLPNAREIEV